MTQETLFNAQPETPNPEPTSVECLGLTFESEDARREYFLERLREKLPELREREDFPRGVDGGPAADEDILRLADPPYYTPCPNPFLADFIEHYGRPYDPEEPYHREPFAGDTSVGKTDPLYKAHGYHTKVPHLAIVPSILHYTKPGDIVLDGFCGSGMTGVAAQWCGTAPADYRRKLEQEWHGQGLGQPEWGARRALRRQQRRRSPKALYPPWSACPWLRVTPISRGGLTGCRQGGGVQNGREPTGTRSIPPDGGLRGREGPLLPARRRQSLAARMVTASDARRVVVGPRARIAHSACRGPGRWAYNRSLDRVHRTSAGLSRPESPA